MVGNIDNFNAHDADSGDLELVELLTSLGLSIHDQGYYGWDIDYFNTLMQGLVIWSWLSCWGCPFTTQATMGGTLTIPMHMIQGLVIWSWLSC